MILLIYTDRCTIIPHTTPNAIETKTAAKLTTLKWTREPSRGKHGIYLIHDGIHYNALSLRDNQEEGEQDEESSIGEYTNQTQQKRTTEHATPTQGIQNTSAPMSKIKLNVFVAEVGFDVAGLFTELINIAMCHVHVFFFNVR